MTGNGRGRHDERHQQRNANGFWRQSGCGRFPSSDLQGQRPLIRQATFKALACEDAQPSLSHVEPGAMRWGVVKAQALHNAIRFSFAEMLDQGMVVMGVKVVQGYINIGALG